MQGWFGGPWALVGHGVGRFSFPSGLGTSCRFLAGAKTKQPFSHDKGVGRATVSQEHAIGYDTGYPCQCQGY
jgi:hypothetical protein